jgi:hypothetical protein
VSEQSKIFKNFLCQKLAVCLFTHAHIALKVDHAVIIHIVCISTLKVDFSVDIHTMCMITAWSTFSVDIHTMCLITAWSTFSVDIHTMCMITAWSTFSVDIHTFLIVYFRFSEFSVRILSLFQQLEIFF